MSARSGSGSATGPVAYTHTYVVWPTAAKSSGARRMVKAIDSDVRPAATGRTWIASRSVRVAPRWWSQSLATTTRSVPVARSVA